MNQPPESSNQKPSLTLKARILRLIGGTKVDDVDWVGLLEKAKTGSIDEQKLIWKELESRFKVVLRKVLFEDKWRNYEVNDILEELRIRFYSNLHAMGTKPYLWASVTLAYIILEEARKPERKYTFDSLNDDDQNGNDDIQKRKIKFKMQVNDQYALSIAKERERKEDFEECIEFLFAKIKNSIILKFEIVNGESLPFNQVLKHAFRQPKPSKMLCEVIYVSYLSLKSAAINNKPSLAKSVKRKMLNLYKYLNDEINADYYDKRLERCLRDYIRPLYVEFGHARKK